MPANIAQCKISAKKLLTKTTGNWFGPELGL